jgi:phage baseplate assembly protein W
MAVGYSVRLPLELSPSDGPFALNKSLYGVVEQNLKMIIFTSPGERVMDANFGVGIRNYLFDQMSDLTMINLRDRILQQIRAYLSFVQVIDLTVSTSEESENAIYVKLVYSFPGSGTQNLELTIR